MLYLFLLTLLFQEPLADADILELAKNNRLDEVQIALEHRDISAYDFGLNLAQNMATNRDALFFFDWARKRIGETPELIYGHAWAYWYTGDGEAALKEVNYLETQNPDEVIQARAFYLSATIHGNQYRRHDIALRELRKSLALYKKLGLNGGIYLNYVSLAENALNRGELEKIDGYLALAREHNKKLRNPYPEAYIHGLQAEHLFKKENFAAAASKYQEAAKIYEEDGNTYMSYSCQTREGLCHAILGNFSTATNIAQKLDKKSEINQVKSAKNVINMIWLRVNYCNGREYEVYQNRIEAEAENTGNRTILTLLEKLLSLPCPE